MDFIGEPYLIGWSDGTLRLYRKSGGVFAQLDSRVAAVHNIDGEYPRPVFTPTGLIFFSNPALGSTTTWLASVDYLDNTLSDHSSLFNMGAGAGTTRRFDVLATAMKTSGLIPASWTTAAANNLIVGWARQADTGSGNTANNPAITFGINESSNLLSGSKPTPGFGVANETLRQRQMELSPDDTILMTQRNTGLYWNEFDITRLTALDPWAAAANDTSNGHIHAFAWGADSQSVVAIAGDQQKLIMYLRGGGISLTQAAVVNLPEQPVSIAYFGPFVAVGLTYNDGTTKYRTRIYKKSGAHLIPHMVIEDMGRDLLFTADGLTLLDCFTKKAYTRVGTVFSDASAMMVNIAANTTTAALSQHTDAGTTALTAFYPGVAADFAADDINMAAVSFLLLDNMATFNASHTTVDEVTASGAHEVSGNNWPVGGLLLSNMLRQKTLIGVDVVADDIDHSIFGGDITARYGLIYSGTQPLIFVDFGASRTIRANEALALDLTGGIVSIGV